MSKKAKTTRKAKTTNKIEGTVPISGLLKYLEWPNHSVRELLSIPEDAEYVDLLGDHKSLAKALGMGVGKIITSLSHRVHEFLMENDTPIPVTYDTEEHRRIYAPGDGPHTAVRVTISIHIAADDDELDVMLGRGKDERLTRLQ